MKKEVFFAIFLGLGLGLIVTFGIYTARSAFLKHAELSDDSAVATPAPTPADASLSLFSPADESIQYDPGFKVTGTTFPNGHVIIFINNAANITTADGSGNFSINTNLTMGSNVITVRSLDDQGHQAEQKRTVILTTPDPVATASANLPATGSTPSKALPTIDPKIATTSTSLTTTASGSAVNPADDIQKLKALVQLKGTEKLNGLTNQSDTQPRGFIGEIQRITDRTITIKGFHGNEILTITTNIPVTRDAKKSSIDDLAVGDWIVAIGSTTKEVFTLKKLDASSTSLLPSTFVTSLETVKTVSKTSITTTTANTTDTSTFAITKNSVFQDNQGNKADPKTIKPDYRYLFVGTQDDTGITLTIVRALGS